MKTMKSLIVFGLLIGFTSMVRAGGRQNQGWNVTVVTGTAITIASGVHLYLKKIVLSTGTTSSLGDYLVAYSSVPTPVTGAGLGLIPNHLYQATVAVVPALIFQTTTTVAATGQGVAINNGWSAGDCDTCFIEIGANGTPSGQGGALHIRKSAEASGQANIATVYWSE